MIKLQLFFISYIDIEYLYKLLFIIKIIDFYIFKYIYFSKKDIMIQFKHNPIIIHELGLH